MENNALIKFSRVRVGEVVYVVKRGYFVKKIAKCYDKHGNVYNAQIRLGEHDKELTFIETREDAMKTKDYYDVALRVFHNAVDAIREVSLRIGTYYTDLADAVSEFRKVSDNQYFIKMK